MSARATLAQATGRTFWRELDRLIERPDIRARLVERFPVLDGFDLARRDILKCLGATLALAGLDGCAREADETAMPFVNDPEGGPGAERHYATAVELDGVGKPVIGSLSVAPRA